MNTGRRERRQGGLLLLCLLLSLGGLLVTASILQAQERTGTISGQLKDASGGVLPGASVVITDKASGRVTTLTTDGSGMYRADLDPGTYSVRFEMPGFARQEQPDVILLLGKIVSLNAEMKVGNLTEAVQVTAETAPLVDTKTVTASHNVTAEEFDRMPKTRTFQSVAITSPGVNQGDIEGGIQVHGASGSENAYTVDGVTTNSLLYGSSRQDTVFEYLQEVEVKTAGIDAQYGGAMGGVISAVTKSGGNIFHGEGHYYYSGNKISAGPVQRIVLSPIDNQTVTNQQDSKFPNNQNEFGGSMGGPIVKDHLFFFGSISPRLLRRSNSYLFSDGTEPLTTFNQKQTLIQGFGKISYASPGRLQANGSALWTPNTTTGTLPAYGGNGTNYALSTGVANSVNQTRGYKQNQFSGGGDVNWLFSRSSSITFRGGYFHDNYMDTGVPNTTSYTYQVTSVGLANIPASLQAPRGTFNTPRIEVSQFDTTTRGYFQGDFTSSFSAGGMHFLKAGAGYQKSSNDVNEAYPGGYVYIYWDQSMTSYNGTKGTGQYGYYRVDDFGTGGKVSGDIASLYVQDAWTPTDRLTFNLGVRTEHERVPSFNPDVKQYAFDFGFGQKIAPRLGVNYDVRGDGKVKVSASWGRYFDWTKYEIARGSFNGTANGVPEGDRWHIFYRSLDTLNIGSLNLNNMPGTDLWGSPTGFRDLRLTSIGNIDPNIKPMFQDSFNGGLDYQLGPATVFSAHYIHNILTRTIEDFSALVGGNNNYLIGNPGEGTSTIFPASYPATANFPMPKPLRQYDAMELSVNRRFAKNWFAAGSYTLSRLYGNYAGIGDSDEISTPTTGVSAGTAQQQSGSIARPGTNTGIAWDIDQILYDSKGHLNPLGRLATDRPNVFKLYGSYAFPTGTEIGLSFYGGSGTPLTTVVNTLDQYYPMVNGRGDMGRTPFLTKTDLLVSHEFKAPHDKKLRLEFQVLNLFNQKTPTHIFSFLNKGAPGGGSEIPQDAIDMSNVNLQAGYDYRAMILATPDGAAAFDPRYGKPDLWQPGLQGQFSARFIF